MSNSNLKKLFTLCTILVGILLVSSCSPSAPTELPIVTSAPTSQPSAEASPTSVPSPLPPTEQVSPTPTEQQFVLPGGRLLFSPFLKSETGVTDFNSLETVEFFSWLRLPEMTVEAHPYLNAVYPLRDTAVTLSPDRSHIVFARETYTQSGDNYRAGRSVSVFLASPDGDEVTQIGGPFSGTYVADNLAVGEGISWSANSQVVAFKLAGFENFKNIYVYDVLSGQFKTLTIESAQPSAFALSPDGTQVAFSDLGASPGLSLINVDGSDQRVIFEGWVGSNLVWHPDGKRIFFESDKPVIAIYSVDVSTGAITPVTPRGNEPFLLSLSPDGSLLAYEDRGLYVVSAEGGEPLRLLGEGPGWHQWVWSPDGQYLAYTAPPLPGIFVMETLGNGQVEVYQDDKFLHGTLIGWLP